MLRPPSLQRVVTRQPMHRSRQNAVVHHIMSPSELFHPAVANWFADRFAAPTPAQAQAWPAITSGRHTLIAAPTGSGKTLAAFLAAIDHLVRQGLEAPLADA